MFIVNEVTASKTSGLKTKKVLTMNKNLKLLVILSTVVLITACSSAPTSLSNEMCAEDGKCINGLTDSEIVLLKNRRRGGAYCGDRVKVDEVLVIDMEKPEDASLLEQAGPYDLLTEAMIGIESRGSNMQSINDATHSAASRGCDILLVGSVYSRKLKLGGVGTPNSTGSPGTPTRTAKYLLVRMGKLK